MSKQKARKGELTGKYGVFYGSNAGTGPTYAVVAQIGKLAALNVENDSVYEWEPILAFDIRDGELLLDYLDLAVEEGMESDTGFVSASDFLAEFERCAHAYIFAKRAAVHVESEEDRLTSTRR